MMSERWRTVTRAALVAALAYGVVRLVTPPAAGPPPTDAPRRRLPEAWHGRCVRVHDGDTIRVRRFGEDLAIRLDGIDCPELKQPFGPEARTRARQLVLGRAVDVLPRELDRYGRVVARVRLADGRDLGTTLVEEGLAWWYREHALRDTALQEAETSARSARRGLWARPAPQAPWEFRREQREQAGLP